MKRWLTYLLFIVLVISTAIAAGIGFELGLPLVLGAGYAGGAAAFFGYIFIAGPSLTDRISSGNSPIRLAAMPTLLMLVVALGVPLAVLLMVGGIDPSALETVLTIDTAMVVLPLSLFTPLRVGVAQHMPWPLIMLAIATVALPVLYVGVLLFEQRRAQQT